MKSVHTYIEYTLLDPLVIDNQIDAAAQLAAKLNIGGVCIPPYWVKKASREIANTSVRLTTVIGYPFGYQRTEAKVIEMELAFADGANAVDLVINLSALKSKRMNWIKAEIAKFAHLVHAKEGLLTVMTDGVSLGEAELETLSKISVDAGADYICIAPAFSSIEYTAQTIMQLRNMVPASVGIKTFVHANGIEQIEEFINAGADIVGVPSIEFLKQK